MPSASQNKSDMIDLLTALAAAGLILLGAYLLLDSGLFPIHWPWFWAGWGITLAGILWWIYRDWREGTIIEEMSLLSVDASYLSESIDPDTKPRRKPKRRLSEDWSVELIGKFEWRVFEKMCMRLWRIKGVSIEATSGVGEVGVNFYLRSKSTKARIGLVRCKNWNKKPISVTLLHEMQAVMHKQHLPMALLMYHGELTDQAQVFLQRPDCKIKAHNSKEILKQIRSLPKQVQLKLLAKCTKGRYKMPSCPYCDVKLEKRVSQVSGAKSLACPNFPQCSFTLNPRNPHARH
ncbi:MAG: hypothetical protein HKN50_09570 [Gammaproteobacteria bacterium]|nr:hypothetical protein [Gammaproteobacteria bacterium]